MRCERAREWLSLRLDDEISEIERLLLRRHLGRCAECTAFAESAQAVTDVLRGADQQVPRPDFGVETPTPKPSRVRLRLRLGFALVVIAAGFGALAGFLTSGAEGPGPVETPPQIAVLPPAAPPAIPEEPEVPEPPAPEPGEEPIAPV